MLYSHSRLNTFENCKQQFKFRYIDKLDMRIEGIEAFMGKRVHESLEFLYHKIRAGTVPEIGDILQEYLRLWKKDFKDDIRIVKSHYTADDYKKLGEKCLINYYTEHHPFDQPVLAIEKRIFVNIDGIKLQGFIDRLDGKDGSYEIHDYKTGMSLPGQDKIDKDRQLALYQLGILQEFKEVKDVKLVWHYLSFGQILESRRDEKQLQKLKESIKKTVHNIETEKDYLPNKTMLCNWCDYKSICPAFKHQRVAKENFTEDDGVKLVSKYAQLKKSADFLKKEVAETKAKILEYSEKLGITSIFGSDYQINVGETSRIMPPSDEKLYSELVKLVKELGMYEKVMKIDITALQTEMEELPLETQTKLKPFLQESKTTRITLSKKR